MRNIPLIKTFLPPANEIFNMLQEVFNSGYIAQGEYVDRFELEFALRFGNKRVVSVNSGTAALHIALILAGIGPEDEVISTPLTAEPTNIAIKMTGAKIIWADIDKSTGLIDPIDVEQKITERTKAIVVVDYAGIPVDISSFQRIGHSYRLPIIEDAAHAIGAKYNSSYLGSHFPFVCFSFQAIKHMTTIDGGMIAFEAEDQYQKAKLIRWFGIDKGKSRLENDIQIQGYKYHMNNVNAAVGICQMRHIEGILSRYIENGLFYDKALLNIPGIELLEYYPNSEPSYWLYTLKVERRNDLVRKLSDYGIIASELHKRNDKHSIFSESLTSLPVLDDFYSKLLHLPSGWWVSTEDRERIVEIIKGGW